MADLLGLRRPKGEVRDTDVPHASSHKHVLSEVEGEVKLRAGKSPESNTCTTANYRPWLWIPASLLE